jgi:aminopeptidase N
MSRKILLFLFSLGLIMACENIQIGKENEERTDTAKAQQNHSDSMHMSINDPHSYSRPAEAVITHLNWEAEVDMKQKVIRATATYDIENKKGVDTIFLDARNLKIKQVSRDDREGELGYELKEKNDVMGASLAIPITPQTKTISITYETTEGADALQFLDPEQTAGKKHSFLFTQSQAILARTWIPVQDSPGIRFSYDAKVKVPQGMLALMSAENPTEVNADGVYEFTMDQPVPSYLMALAVGNLVFEPIGEETGVYAEPELIKSAAHEFADMQDMVDTAEALYGEYRWGRYDVIVLPPSFPFGGMENPRLTFATPTIIAGDRSLTALIAHELAHSWSGNLVTNANWEDIWLNEGFTVYFENRIMEEIYGKDMANMLALLSLQDLKDEIEQLKSEGRAADTRLKVDLKGRNPDDGLTGVPYDKGFYFLKLIEETVGRQKWDAFLADYFDEHAFKVMTTDKFLQELDEELLSENPAWKENIRVEEWVHGEGLPDNYPKIESRKFAQVKESLQNWKTGTTAGKLKTENWVTPQWLYFITNLENNLSQDQMQQLDNQFGFTKSGNKEIQAAWMEKTIPLNYAPAIEESKDFLVEVGRRKFLVPIYKAILRSEAGKDKALAIYKEARPNYHAVSRETLDKILNYGA